MIEKPKLGQTVYIITKNENNQESILENKMNDLVENKEIIR